MDHYKKVTKLGHLLYTKITNNKKPFISYKIILEYKGVQTTLFSLLLQLFNFGLMDGGGNNDWNELFMSIDMDVCVSDVSLRIFSSHVLNCIHTLLHFFHSHVYASTKLLKL